MQSIRSLLRRDLGRSLASLPQLDRLAAAWPVVCGITLAHHGRLTALDAGVLTLTVDDSAWLPQFISMRSVLQHDLARVAKVPLTGIHFILAGKLPRAPRGVSPAK